MILWRAPTQRLKSSIRYYYLLRQQIAPQMAVWQPVPARSRQVVEFMLGTPYRVQRLALKRVEEAHAIALVGVQTHRRVDLLLSGGIDAFGIVFEPGGFQGLFSLPADELTNSDIDGRCVIGRDAAELHEQLAAAATFDDRVRVADQLLGVRGPVLAPVTPALWAARELHSRRGRTRVADLAAAVELSVRQFERVFRREVGMPPKHYARVIRFEAALRARAAHPERPWTGIAHALGYFDQMHMVHDFNWLSGESPTRIGDRLDMFVQVEVAAEAIESAPIAGPRPSVPPRGLEAAPRLLHPGV